MVGRSGYLRKENGHSVDDENKNGNGSNGNGDAVSEEGLRDWFGKSKSKDGKSGWVNVVTGGTCASDKPGEGTPKCVSSSKRSSMTKAERLSASRRKKKADPGQQSKSGSAKPTYVSTDSKKMKSVKEAVDFVTLPLEIEIPNDIRDFNLGLMFRESLSVNSGMYFMFEEVGQKSFYMRETKIPLDIAFITEDGTIDSIKELEPYNETPVESEGEVLYALEVNRGWFAENNVEVGDEINVEISEASDKKGKGSGSKDACYHKVKSRYSVWPSAYASGALVKCRKKGAANWGNSTKKEEFEIEEKVNLTKQSSKRKSLGRGSSIAQGSKKTGYESPSEFRKTEKKLAPYMKENEQIGEACWKGYEKKGMKTMFGKRYPNCVKKTKKEEIEITDAYGETYAVIQDIVKPEPLKPTVNPIDYETYDIDKMTEAVRLQAKTGNLVDTYFNYRGKYFSLKMFFPQISVPKKSDVQNQIEKVYPGAKLQTFRVSEYVPGQPVLHAEGAAWTKKSGKNKEGGLNEKGRKSYEKENPGSDLKAPSKKVGNPRRASFCARMKGMKSKLTSAKTSRDPDSRINKSLRKWNC
jgi:uncharacterized membrane protein (UPF0127 family)